MKIDEVHRRVGEILTRLEAAIRRDQAERDAQIAERRADDEPGTAAWSHGYRAGARAAAESIRKGSRS